MDLLIGASLWMNALFSSSLFEIFTRDPAGYFSSFLVSLTIFSSCNLMHSSFSSLSLTSLSSVAFLVAISSSKLFVPIFITSMTTVLKELPFVSNWKACLSDGEEESLLLASLRGFGLCLSTRHFLLQVLLFGWRCHYLSYYDHPCSFSHTSHFRSMHPSFVDGASLASSFKERSGVLLRSLWGNVFSGDGWFKGDIVWTWRSWFWRKRWEVEIVPPEVPKFVIIKNMNKWNLYWVSKNLDTISNICYKWTNIKFFDFDLHLQGFST